MKFYLDKEKKQEWDLNKPFDLGIVQAGDTKRYELYVYNDTKGDLKDLKFQVLHPEIKIISAPYEIKIGETKTLILEWSPSLTLEEGLGAKIKVNAIKLLYPPTRENWR